MTTAQAPTIEITQTAIGEYAVTGRRITGTVHAQIGVRAARAQSWSATPEMPRVSVHLRGLVVNGAPLTGTWSLIRYPEPDERGWTCDYENSGLRRADGTGNSSPTDAAREAVEAIAHQVARLIYTPAAFRSAKIEEAEIVVQLAEAKVTDAQAELAKARDVLRAVRRDGPFLP